MEEESDRAVAYHFPLAVPVKVAFAQTPAYLCSLIPENWR
jgi:hypothetical protein